MGFTINIPGTVPSLEDFRQSIPIGVSALGTPVFDDVTFLPGNYKPKGGGKQVEYAGLSLQAVKVVVTQSKNIVKTQVAGRDGTIKEYCSLGDFNINITAKISELFNIFPADQLFAWKGLAFTPVKIEIISKFINEYFEVYDVVVTDFDASPVVGSLNEVNLNISLLSDDDIDFNKYVI